MLGLDKLLEEGISKVELLLLEDQKEIEKFFQASSSLNQSIKSIPYLPADDSIRVRAAFDSLMANFEAGLLFVKEGKSWRLSDRFSLGLREESLNYTMDLPRMSPLQVLRVHPKAFQRIENLRLPFFTKDASALLFRPCENYSFILFSEFPNVILKQLSDETQEFLLKAFAY